MKAHCSRVQALDHMLISCILYGRVWSYIHSDKHSVALYSLYSHYFDTVHSERLSERCGEKDLSSSLFSLMIVSVCLSVSTDIHDFSWTMSAHNLTLIVVYFCCNSPGHLNAPIQWIEISWEDPPALVSHLCLPFRSSDTSWTWLTWLIDQHGATDRQQLVHCHHFLGNTRTLGLLIRITLTQSESALRRLSELCEEKDSPSSLVFSCSANHHIQVMLS